MNTMTRCGCCGGSGEVQDLEVRQHGRYQMRWAPCRECNGTGEVVTIATSPRSWSYTNETCTDRLSCRSCMTR